MAKRKFTARARVRPNPAPVSPARTPAFIASLDAFEECIGALSLVEVTLHSLKAQDIALPEQQVLRIALKALRCVRSWLGNLPAFSSDNGTDRENAS